MSQFRRAAAPGTDPPRLHVSWTRLPVLWWRDVPVIKTEPVELTVLDTYMAGTAARLGHLEASTFEELTGLPPLVFDALGRRLHGMDLITWQDNGYVPTGSAADALARGTTVRHTETTLDLLYLPATDDLLVIEETLADFERAALKITGTAPLPATLHATTRRELLASRIEVRRIAGLPPSVVGLAGDDDDNDEPLTAMAGASLPPPVPVCPAIEGSATIEFHGECRRAMLDLGKRRRKRRKKTPDGNDQDQPVTLDISGAATLIDEWCHMADQLGDPASRTAAVAAVAPATVPLTPEFLHQAGVARWSLALTGDQAAAIAETGPLTRPTGLEIRSKHAHVTTTVAFTPADPAAERLFRLDELIRYLLANPGVVADTVASEEAEVHSVGGAQVLRQRAWQLEHRWLVHALREREDFDYA